MEIHTGSRSIVDPNSFREKTALFIKRLNKEAKEFCEDRSVPVVDLYSSLGSKEREDLLDPSYAIGDNAHLNIDGQIELARTLKREYFTDPDDFEVIVCLGDSHTQGFPVRNDISRNGEPVDIEVDSPHQFPYHLTKWTGKTFINRGIAGNTIYGLKKRFEPEVLPHFPDHCIIQGGTNDSLIGTPLEESLSDLKELVEKCIDNEITPVVCTVIPLGF